MKLLEIEWDSQIIQRFVVKNVKTFETKLSEIRKLIIADRFIFVSRDGKPVSRENEMKFNLMSIRSSQNSYIFKIKIKTEGIYAPFA